jgi:hypothetical protein
LPSGVVSHSAVHAQLRVTTCKQAEAEPAAGICFAAVIRDLRAPLMGRKRPAAWPCRLALDASRLVRLGSFEIDGATGVMLRSLGQAGRKPRMPSTRLPLERYPAMTPVIQLRTDTTATRKSLRGCFGVGCPGHHRCARYEAVASSEASPETLGTCLTGDGLYPMFIEVGLAATDSEGLERSTFVGLRTLPGRRTAGF